jgi:hypothetical protein
MFTNHYTMTYSDKAEGFSGTRHHFSLRFLLIGYLKAKASFKNSVSRYFSSVYFNVENESGSRHHSFLGRFIVMSKKA